MWYTNIQNRKLGNKIIVGALLLMGIISWSALVYWLKYLYTIMGDVPFYRLDLHLVFIIYCIVTPTIIIPFVRYFDSKFVYAHYINYTLISCGAIGIVYVWSVLYFVVVRLIFTGYIGLPTSLIMFNALDWVVTFSVPFVFIVIGYFFIKKNSDYRKSIQENKSVILQHQLDSLRQGFEPHFLFNNLNILHHLVDSDKGKAKDFIADLAFLYRYIIKSNHKAVISLEEEIYFAQKYQSIINVKFNNCYRVNFLIDDVEDMVLIPNTLQVLIENFVKHNPCDKDEKIELNIERQKQSLLVNNKKKISKKSVLPSNNTGLKNLIQQYKIGLNADVIVREEKENFIVIIPLISENQIAP